MKDEFEEIIEDEEIVKDEVEELTEEEKEEAGGINVDNYSNSGSKSINVTSSDWYLHEYLGCDVDAVKAVVVLSNTAGAKVKYWKGDVAVYRSRKR